MFITETDNLYLIWQIIQNPMANRLAILIMFAVQDVTNFFIDSPMPFNYRNVCVIVL